MTNLMAIAPPIYLASPYTHYRRGHVGAYLDVCKLAAVVQRKFKIVLFSPISHCHGLTTHGDLPAVDHDFWERFNRPFIKSCGGLLVAMMDGWRESRGVKDEIAAFHEQGKPIFYLDPVTLEPADKP